MVEIMIRHKCRINICKRYDNFEEQHGSTITYNEGFKDLRSTVFVLRKKACTLLL